MRILDIASENLEVIVVDAGESTYRYGPTQKILHFTDQNVVMPFTFSNADTDFGLTASIFIFDKDETEIDKWISNRYKDVYEYGAPRPTDRVDLKSRNFEIKSTELVTHEVGSYGDEYDTYSVRYTISDMAEDDLFELNGFEDATPVHVMTKERLFILDVNSEEVETLAANTPTDNYHYGPTQKFFHFREQNVVIRAYFSDRGIDIEPILSIHIFSSDEQRISRWIKKQYDAGIYSSPDPIQTIHIAPQDIKIKDTQFMTHEVGTNGDEYDTSNMEYMIHDVAQEYLFSLKGFEDEMHVHIRTSDIHRVLDITNEHVETSVADTYLDIYHYGPTEKYYHFTDQHAVLKAQFPNHSVDIEPTFSLYIFDMDEMEIDRWIDDQHLESAYLWPLSLGFNLPEPTQTIDIQPSNYVITLTTPISHEVGTYGDEYDTHTVEYVLDDLFEDGVFKLNGFSDEVPAHIRTKDVVSDNLHLLDITSDEVKIELQTNGFFGPYVSTKKFFHFTDQNVLLGVYFSNYNTDFEPTISIIVFDDEQILPNYFEDREAEIHHWIAEQQPFDMLPLTQPIHIIDISPEYYEVTSTQFVEHVVGPKCGRYDKYNINYTIHDVADERLFELSGFQDEIPVYVMIKPPEEPLIGTPEPGTPARICLN